MTTTIVDKTNLSFAEYLQYNNGTDDRYELLDGEPILMNPPTGRHALILRNLCLLLEGEFARLALPWVALQMFGIRTGLRRSRLPDLCVTTMAKAEELLDVSAVLEEGALLVVEVVSADSVKTDYRYKRTEYANVGVAEYWIVDPLLEKVVILQLEDGLYEEREYKGVDLLESGILPELKITTDRVLLNPKKQDDSY